MPQGYPHTRPLVNNKVCRHRNVKPGRTCPQAGPTKSSVRHTFCQKWLQFAEQLCERIELMRRHRDEAAVELRPKHPAAPQAATSAMIRRR